MNLSEISKDERSLLLYIESVAVDNYGLVDSRKINLEDLEILKQWDKDGFISFSRLTWATAESLSNKYQTSVVYLSDDAWKLAHEERRARQIRMAGKLNLMTTKVKNSKFILKDEKL